ncbi:hypothetical protein MKW92_012486 [Papaver armeniacum]|nr:hypothetical protein MKW92_012486 [Papaver armeniacum]
MSWHRDPELFICHWSSTIGWKIYRIKKKYNVPLLSREISDGEELNFDKHLSTGTNKESDYDTLKSYLAKTRNEKILKFINCQGLVAYWNKKTRQASWATQVEDVTLIVNSLPAGNITNPSDIKLAEKRAAEEKISKFVAEISSLKEMFINEVTYLHGKLNQEKNDREALQTQVLDLTAKLKECCGAGGGIDGV